jgi:hypothetical protein
MVSSLLSCDNSVIQHSMFDNKITYLNYVQVLNLVGCILLCVLDQVQGFPSNATLFQ